jgi:hypothetical protein
MLSVVLTTFSKNYIFIKGWVSPSFFNIIKFKIITYKKKEFTSLFLFA